MRPPIEEYARRYDITIMEGKLMDYALSLERRVEELEGKLREAEDDSISNYEYWSGLKWVPCSPLTIKRRKKQALEDK